MLFKVKGKWYRYTMPEWVKMTLFCAGGLSMIYLLFGIYADASQHPIW